MGYMRHHAFVVSASYGEYLKEARCYAIEIGMTATPLITSPTNGVCSFMVAPDGSKEGWPDSHVGDEARDRFKQWLNRCRYEDGSGPLSWAEIQYGDDNLETIIVAHSDEDFRRKPGSLP